MSFWDNKPAVEAEIKPPVTNPDPNAPVQKSAAELLSEALSPLTQQFQAINDRLNTIEESTRKPVREQPITATEPTSFFEDENAAFNQRITPVVMRQLELEARMVTSDIKGEYTTAGFGDLWKKYEKEISAQLENSSLIDSAGRPLRGNPDYVRNVVDMVLGRAARQGGLKFNGDKQTFFLESAGGDSNANAGAANLTGLSDAQLKVFRRMGIDPAQGKQTVDKLQFIN